MRILALSTCMFFLIAGIASGQESGERIDHPHSFIGLLKPGQLVTYSTKANGYELKLISAELQELSESAVTERSDLKDSDHPIVRDAYVRAIKQYRARSRMYGGEDVEFEAGPIRWPNPETTKRISFIGSDYIVIARRESETPVIAIPFTQITSISWLAPTMALVSKRGTRSTEEASSPELDKYLKYAQRIVERFDKNSDKVLTKDEFSSMVLDISAADGNGDGEITSEEYAQWMIDRAKKR